MSDVLKNSINNLISNAKPLSLVRASGARFSLYGGACHLLLSTGRLEMRSFGMPMRKRRTFALTPEGASTTSTSLARSRLGGRRGCTYAPNAAATTWVRKKRVHSSTHTWGQQKTRITCKCVLTCNTGTPAWCKLKTYQCKVGIAKPHT